MKYKIEFTLYTTESVSHEVEADSLEEATEIADAMAYDNCESLSDAEWKLEGFHAEVHEVKEVYE